MRRRCIALSATLFFVCPCFLAAAEPKVADKQVYNIFTDEDEQKIGDMARRKVEQTSAIVHNPEIDAYLTRMVRRLVATSQRPKMPVTVALINEKTVNAVTYPGGHIYVYRGLLDLLDQESELSGTMGHEIGHAVARHSMNKLSLMAGVNVMVQGARMLGALTDKSLSDMIEKLGGPVVLFGDATFSRMEEREADLLAFYEMERAGWDPSGMLTLFEKLGRFSGPRSLIDQWFSSHPPSSERAEAIRAELKQARLPAGLAMDSAAFRQMKAALRTLPPPVTPRKN